MGLFDFLKTNKNLSPRDQQMMGDFQRSVPPEPTREDPEEEITEAVEQKPRHEIQLKQGGSIFLEQIGPHTFKIVDNTFMYEKSKLLGALIGYKDFDNEVENLLHPNSDVACFTELSDEVRWKDVHFLNDTITAPSIERIIEALDHVTLDDYDTANF